MSELSLDALGPRIEPTDEYQKAVIKANRRLAEARITRIDYRHSHDGWQRFLRSLENLK